MSTKQSGMEKRKAPVTAIEGYRRRVGPTSTHRNQIPVLPPKQKKQMGKKKKKITDLLSNLPLKFY